MNIHEVYGIPRDVCHVTDAPVVDCAQTWARVGDSDVRLQCRVRSRPGPTALYWVVDANGTIVSSGDTLNDYWTLVRVSRPVYDSSSPEYFSCFFLENPNKHDLRF